MMRNFIISTLPLNISSFPLVQQPNAGQGHFIAEVSRSHTVTHPQSVELIWTVDQPDVEMFA